MPLKSGSSQKTISSNISELHGGKTYARTAAKFGKTKANKQAVAIALSETRERAFGGGILPGVGGMMQNGSMPLQGAPAGLAGFGAGQGPQEGNSASMGVSPPVDGVIGMAGGGGIHMERTPHLGHKAPNMTKGPLLSSVPGRTDSHKTHVPSGSYVIPADIVSGRGQGNTLAGVHTLQQMFKMGPYGSSPGQVKGGSSIKKFAQGGDVGGDEQPVRVDLAGGEIVVPPENLQQVVHPDLKTAHNIMDAWVIHERKKLRKTLAGLPGPVKED